MTLKIKCSENEIMTLANKLQESLSDERIKRVVNQMFEKLITSDPDEPADDSQLTSA